MKVCEGVRVSAVSGCALSSCPQPQLGIFLYPLLLLLGQGGALGILRELN